MTSRTRYLLAATLCALVIAAAIAQDRGGPANLLEIPKVSKDKRICFCLYTVHDDILKLTAQLYPLDDADPRVVRLEVERGGEWTEIASAPVITPGWTATFRVTGWDTTKDAPYRVRHGESALYEGLIRHDPVEKDEITVVAFTGNSIYPGHGGDIPKGDIVENVKRLKPDLLFFSGDQVYDHNRHYAYWLKFGRDFGEIIRQYPSITIPDDHDVGQPNLWGAGGKKAERPDGADGGYVKPVEYVKEAERAQTSHLPDPFDPTPIQRDIGVYYTALDWGGISFAIIEDRKFKSGPAGLVPNREGRPDHVTNPSYDPKSLDVPGAHLLGERQIKFLRQWASNWRGAEMKCVLSQTIFCGSAQLMGKADYRVFADLDCNGWPKSGRDAALREMRKCFAFHIAGDQHLGSIIHQGIDDWNDACYSFCVPSIANLYLRWWKPLVAGTNRKPGMPDSTGEFTDGLGNKITVWAVANPSPEENHDKLTTRAAGFGVVRFNKAKRTVTMECWPRNVNVADPRSKQYPGWPLTISQLDNYARKPAGYLPTLIIKQVPGNGVAVADATDPVVQVVEEKTGEIVYTLRVNGAEFRPEVFHEGIYTIRIGDGRSWTRQFKGLKPTPSTEPRELVITL